MNSRILVVLLIGASALPSIATAQAPAPVQASQRKAGATPSATPARRPVATTTSSAAPAAPQPAPIPPPASTNAATAPASAPLPARAPAKSASGGSGMAALSFDKSDPEGPGGRDAWKRVPRWEDHKVLDKLTPAIQEPQRRIGFDAYARQMAIPGTRSVTIINGVAY